MFCQMHKSRPMTSELMSRFAMLLGDHNNAVNLFLFSGIKSLNVMHFFIAYMAQTYLIHYIQYHVTWNERHNSRCSIGIKLGIWLLEKRQFGSHHSHIFKVWMHLAVLCLVFDVFTQDVQQFLWFKSRSLCKYCVNDFEVQ